MDINTPQTREETTQPILNRRGALILSVALLAGGTAVAAENVTAETRAKVEALQASDPNFKLKTFFRKCLAGEVEDPNCEKGLSGYIENYIGEKQVSTDRAQVSADRAQVSADRAQVSVRNVQVNIEQAQVNIEQNELKIIDDTIFHLDISLALIQLANYVAYNEPIPNDGGKIKAIISSSNTPAEIKIFMQSLKDKKDAKIPTEYNPEGKMLLSYIKQHLDMAITNMNKLTIKNKTYDNLEKQIALMRQVYPAFDGAFGRKVS